jgi:hypothetical protein
VRDLGRQQPAYALDESRGYLACGEARPLHREESIRYVGVAFRSVVDADRNKKCALAPYEVRALLGEVPFEAEVALCPRLRPRGNDRHEERAVADLLADLLVPDIPAPQLALVEPDLDAGYPQRFTEPCRRLGIL